MAEVIRLKNQVLEQMADHVLQDPRLECCGLLAGSGRVITRAITTTNAMASATEYAIAPKELFQSMREIRAA